MINWGSRPVEIANLLNPAFCGFLIREFLKGYEEKKGEGMPYELVFLLLPIVLHKHTRNLLPRSISTFMHVWLQSNPEIRIGFSKRTKDLIPFTKEAILFMIKRDLITTDENGRLYSSNKPYNKSLLRLDEDIRIYLREYQSKAKLIGKWFAVTGTSSTIYTMWGISP